MYSTKVVVLGAGVVGCAAAFYLARYGAKVTIVERDAVGSGASGFALGLLNPLTGSGIPGPIALPAEQAFRMHKELWPEIEDVSGIDLQAREMTHLQLCFNENDVLRERNDMDRWNKVDGFSAEWLDGTEVLGIEPRISPLITGAVLLRHIWVLDSYRLTLAMFQAAKTLGTEFVQGSVIGIESANGHVNAVYINDQTVDCDAVVIAMGPWSGQSLVGVKTPMPITPLKGQILHMGAPAKSFPYNLAGPGQITQKADGMVWIASTEEDSGWDTELTQMAHETLMGRAIKMVPSIAKLKLVRQTACLRPVTPDRLPIVGPFPGLTGAYLATGAEKKGILLGPIMGSAVADLVVSGKTTLPIEALSPERFIS